MTGYLHPTPQSCSPPTAALAIGGQVFADSVVATAIVDRLLHSATVVNVRGRSYSMPAHQDTAEGKNGQ